MVRDSVSRDGAVIEFSASAWESFATKIKNGSAA
jgi:hypothetical protein